MDPITRKAIEEYYWDVVEWETSGYGDTKALDMISNMFDVSIDWEELYAITKEFGYSL